MVLVIGVGNRWRGDDGAGPAVARALSEVPGIRVAECTGEPTEIMACWSGQDRVIVVDAVSAGGPPGSIHRFTANSPLPVPGRHSSHGMGVAEAVELARSLGELPAQLTIYGIEPDRMTDGEGLSPSVRAAVAVVAAAIIDEVQGGTSGTH
ncbi:hydrogenase maturation protease [Thioalkalivibrio denitrificans]|uniref:Hydrogenase maturation protease n=2 Tax=Thioalkalivibrio denitrificans TaxID=108003 RepID=A0A1V3NL99_9GAMM|nr:hydrogenase maturation protease [Thioalkalivibrio denitrificans]